MSSYCDVIIYVFRLHAPWLKCNILNELDKQLQLVVSSSLGSPVVYLLVETVRSFMCNYLSSSTENLTIHKVEESSSQSVPENHELPSAVVSVPSVKSHLDISPQILPFALNSKVPEIYHGEPLIDRKSVFQVTILVIKRSIFVSYQTILSVWRMGVFLLKVIVLNKSTVYQ